MKPIFQVILFFISGLIFMPQSIQSQGLNRIIFFNLIPEEGSPEAETFFKATLSLGEISALKDFQLLKVKSENSEYEYFINLVFEDQNKVEDYVKDPRHTNFLKEFWKSNVSDAKLIDLIEFLPED